MKPRWTGDRGDAIRQSVGKSDCEGITLRFASPAFMARWEARQDIMPSRLA